MPAPARLLRVADYRRTPWKNGGGWTTQIASHPSLPDEQGAIGDFDWRVSIADIESSGPFSTFADVDRELVLLAGNGIELDIDDDPPRRLEQRFQRIRFAGEQRVQCHLLAGPTRDFNVMVRRGQVTAEVIARPLTGSMLIFPEPHVTWLIHVFAGHARARAGKQDIAAGLGETLLIEHDQAQLDRIVIDGAGELVMARLEDLGARDAAQERR